LYYPDYIRDFGNATIFNENDPDTSPFYEHGRDWAGWFDCPGPEFEHIKKMNRRYKRKNDRKNPISEVNVYTIIVIDFTSSDGLKTIRALFKTRVRSKLPKGKNEWWHSERYYHDYYTQPTRINTTQGYTWYH